MKKLIAISVVFALVAGVAFAEVNVGGDVFGKVVLVQGDTGKTNYGTEDDPDFKNTKPTSAGELKRARLELSGQDDDGIFGGYLRLDHGAWWGAGAPVVSAAANVWWKPIDQFKFLIGGNGHDGFFGADGITRWGFYQVAADGVGVFNENWYFSGAFYGGFANDGAILTLTPMDALEINIGIPFIAMSGSETGDVFMSTNAQVAYTIDGIGKLAITYAGNLGDEVRDPHPWESWWVYGNGSKLYAYFGLTAIENLGVDIGFGYTLSAEDEASKITYNAPIAVGLGVSYNADAFGVKARVQGEFGETAKAKGGSEIKGPMVITADVLPSFGLSDKLTVLLDAGLRMIMPDEGDSVVGWHVEPALSLKSNWWAPNFYAGIRIESDGEKDADDKTTIKWSVPIGMAFSF